METSYLAENYTSHYNRSFNHIHQFNISTPKTPPLVWFPTNKKEVGNPKAVDRCNNPWYDKVLAPIICNEILSELSIFLTLDLHFWQMSLCNKTGLCEMNLQSWKVNATILLLLFVVCSDQLNGKKKCWSLSGKNVNGNGNLGKQGLIQAIQFYAARLILRQSLLQIFVNFSYCLILPL